MQRAIVGIRASNGKYKIPKFSECLVEYFTKDSCSVLVDFSLENGMLVLDESEKGFELSHSPQCPFKQLPASQLELLKNNDSANIGVAASVVIESSDSYVLLTKRSAQMRASPNVWVMPGGHLENEETLLEAGVREVKEETGLDISQENASILGLWENVYPLILGAGTPKSHVLIVYFHTKLNETRDSITKKLIPNPEEVDSFCWLNTSTLTKLFNIEEDGKAIDGEQYVYENEQIVEKYLDYSKMFNRWLRIQPDPYSGVNYALRKWLKKVSDSKPFSKY